MQGVYVDGTYFVRERVGYPDDFALSVVYKGQPSHHLLSKDDDTGYAPSLAQPGDAWRRVA